MNTRSTFQTWPTLTIGALASLGFLLAACGEQAGEQQQSTAPTTEQQSESSTQ